jgi:methionyl-tRNA synthetase
LADILGNFVNRALVLTQKYYDGAVPEVGEFSDYDQEVLAEMAAIPDRISKLIYAYKLREAQSEAMNLARLGNKYLADMEPWKLIKDEKNTKRVQTIMNIALQITANLSIVLQPFLPATASKISTFLNYSNDQWSAAGQHNLLSAGQPTAKPSILFQKIEDTMVEKEIEKLNASKTNVPQFEPQKEEASFDDFTKMDIRVGTILEAEKIKKADKLLKLLVDTGLDKRTIVSGIAKYYTPQEVIGKKVTVLLNLAPRKIEVWNLKE